MNGPFDKTPRSSTRRDSGLVSNDGPVSRGVDRGVAAQPQEARLPIVSLPLSLVRSITGRRVLNCLVACAIDAALARDPGHRQPPTVTRGRASADTSGCC